MRLGSVSKWWAMAAILQLVQEGKLRLGDTVQCWLPGLLPYGNRITIEQLMTGVATRLQANPATEASPLWMIRLGAWQPLVLAPGSRYHHSNISWNIVGADRWAPRPGQAGGRGTPGGPLGRRRRERLRPRRLHRHPADFDAIDVASAAPR